MQLRNLKIGIRAASVFALLGILVLFMGLIALYETRQMDKATDEIRVTWMPAVIALGDISTNLGRARAVTLRAALDDNPSDRERNLQMLNGINTELNNALKDYADTIIAADDRALFNAFSAAYQHYFELQTRVLQDIQAGHMDDAKQQMTAHVAGERDTFGRLKVDGHLKVLGQEHVYATGDTAWAAVDDLGNHALMTCQHAIPMGRHAGNNAAADLLGLQPVLYRQPKYVTCLDLGDWGAAFSEGWERELQLHGQEGKALKRQINSVWIYPPAADRALALAAADPMIAIV